MPAVVDIYSVSDCVNENFAGYINFWKHNGFWLFDSPSNIREVAKEAGVDLSGTQLFYFEAHEMEFNGTQWRPFAPETGVMTEISLPAQKKLEGFDVVTFYARNSPECSPLSCNGLGESLPTNEHCLFESFEVAKSQLDAGSFNECEPGPYRIYAVYSVDWP